MRLILSDIDGTILPFGRRSVSERTHEAFYAALDAGLFIGPASGRALHSVAPAFDGDARCMETALASNGMEVYLGGELIHREFLPHDAVTHIAEVVKRVPGAGLFCFVNGRTHMISGDVSVLAESFAAYAADPVFCDRVPEVDLVKANIFCPDDLATTQALLEIMVSEVSELDFNLPCSGFLNVTPKGYSKASGIDILCEALGIGLDEVVVFGDANNDLEMIAHVPNSVAVENATDEIKAAARWHVGACEDEAVQDAMFALAAGEFPFTE